jgi:hypothetical protein
MIYMNKSMQDIYRITLLNELIRDNKKMAYSYIDNRLINIVLSDSEITVERDNEIINKNKE